MIGTPNNLGLPGAQPGLFMQRRNVFFSNREAAELQMLPAIIPIDGAPGNLLTGGTGVGGAGNPLASPYTYYLWAGLEVAKESAQNQYITAIIGLTTVGYSANGTSLTVSPQTAAEIVRRIGNSGSLIVTGDNNLANGGTVYTSTFPFSAVNQTTGVITVTGQGQSIAQGAFVGSTDGSAMGYTGSSNGTQTYSGTSGVGLISSIYTILCDQEGVNLASLPPGGGVRISAVPAQLWGGAGIINTGMLPNWPVNSTPLQAFYKGCFASTFGNALFSATITG